MTIEGQCFDGWTIREDYRSKPASSHIEDRIKDTLKGRELAIAIRQSLKDRGIEISDERYELIAEACEKEEK